MSAMLIEGRHADLGDGVVVRRFIPSRQQRMVGAWCFLDHAGPVEFAPGRGMHVGAHPHIGLQTFTWMIEGQLLHRDSLGNEQVISPGEVNLMTAGHGIVHTEDSLHGGQRLHAGQLWIALPPGMQDCAPAFAYYATLPRWHEHGAQMTLLAGSYGGQTAPTEIYSPLLGLNISSALASTVQLTLNEDFEYGLLPLTGHVLVDGAPVKADQFAYLGRGRRQLELTLAAGSQALFLGGEPFAQPVLMWWNFVGYTKAEIAEAQRQWEQEDARFPQVADGQAMRLTAPPLPWNTI